MDNRAGELAVFAAAAELASFSAAGRRLGVSPSAVSKLVTRIEDRLGTRLLVRSTRALQLTPEGELYLRHAQRILADIDETEREISGGAAAVPRGRLRVSASVAFGASCVVPRIPAFLERYPQVTIDLTLSDAVIDLIEERTDVALRSGPMRDSTLKARKILEGRRVVVASPDYLARHGTPRHPDELAEHNCLGLNFRRSQQGWPFRDKDGREFTMDVGGNFLSNQGITQRQLCLAGLGIARTGRFHVEKDIANGRLIALLEPFNPGDIELVHAVYVGHAHLAARIRAFVDFLAAHVGQDRS